MKYNWPMVVIGATLMMIGPALPWFRWSGGGPFLMPGQPTSGYISGYGSLGFVSGLGGLVLMFITLMETGESDGQGSFFVSLLFGVLIAGAACFALQPVIAEPANFSPAFGFFVSLLGVALGIIGSRIQVSGAAMNNKASIAVLVALEFFIILCGWVLITHPGVGVSLGVWETPKRNYVCLMGIGDPSQYAQEQYDRCVGTATAEATHPTATLEPWWQQWGH